MLAWLAASLALPGASSGFSATTLDSVSATSLNLDAYLPGSPSAQRLTQTTCRVSFTPVGGLPSGVTYAIDDGTSTTPVASAVTTSPVTIPVGTSAYVPRISVRVGSWVSAHSVDAMNCVPALGAPTGLLATAGDASAVLTWASPSENGGASITKYVATAQPGGITCESTTQGCTMYGLDNGTTYTITVVAVTSMDTSAPSSSVTVTPVMSAGMLTGFGENGYGQLGFGTKTSTVLNRVATESDWASVSSGATTNAPCAPTRRCGAGARTTGDSSASAAAPTKPAR